MGEVTRVDPTLLRSLVNSGYLPVVATVATDEHGQALNVNADTAAGEVGTKGVGLWVWNSEMPRSAVSGINMCRDQHVHGPSRRGS